MEIMWLPLTTKQMRVLATIRMLVLKLYSVGFSDCDKFNKVLHVSTMRLTLSISAQPLPRGWWRS
eukprot:9235079-Ditylum_brightwellii.AAC.2